MADQTSVQNGANAEQIVIDDIYEAELGPSQSQTKRNVCKLYQSSNYKKPTLNCSIQNPDLFNQILTSSIDFKYAISAIKYEAET